MISLNLTKKLRFSSLMNGVFIGVGIAFMLWGATDIAFPIAERMSVAVFGLMKIILGIVSLSVGTGVEAVQWAKIGSDLSLIDLYEQMPPEQIQPQIEQTKPQTEQPQPVSQPAQPQTETVEQQKKPSETPSLETPVPSAPSAAPAA